MRIVILVENEAGCPGLCCEHGLSIHVTKGNHRVLFDMGASDAFARNASRLGIDLTRVDAGVISHGHDDHGGGAAHFRNCNLSAPVYISTYAAEPHFNRAGKDIGLSRSLPEAPGVVTVQRDTQILPGMTLLTRPEGADIRPWGSFGQTWGADRRPEDYRHELCLLVEEKGRRVLFSGCSHIGCANLVRRFHPDVFIGGFHTMHLPPRSQALQALARELLEGGTVYYTCHCTGQAQYEAMKAIMGERLFRLRTGDVLEL